MVFTNLENNRYVSDGNSDTIIAKSDKESSINNNYDKKVITY